MNQTTTIAIVLGLLLIPNAIVSMSTISKSGATAAMVETHTRAGEEALTAEKFERAEAAFRMALSIDSTSEAGQQGLARTQAHRITSREESVSRSDAISLGYIFELALKNDAKHAEVYQVGLGLVTTALGDKEGAKAWFDKATASKSASSAAWMARGNFEIGQKDLTAASASLAKAVALDDKNGKAKLGYGIVLKRQKKYAEAVAQLQKATSALPGPKAWYELGDSFLRDSKFEPAYNAFVSAAKVHPNVNKEPSLLKRLGVTAYRLKKYQEAIGYLTQATQVDKDPEVALNLGIAYQGAGNHTSAAQQLSKVVQQRPAHAEARAYLMKSLVQINQIDAARKIGRQYLVLAQNRPAMKPGAQIITNMLGQLKGAPSKTTRPSGKPQPQAAPPAAQ